MLIKDLILLLLLFYYNNSEIVGRKRIHKILYLLKYKHNISMNYKFTPYHYGPYSESLASIMDTLISIGILEEHKKSFDNYPTQYFYKLSSKGRKIVGDSINKVSTEDRKFIDNLVMIYAELTNMKTYKLLKLCKETFPNTDLELVA